MFPEKKYLSPTGKYVFQIAAWEVRMSHWIESFTLVESATGAVVLRLGDSHWSLDKAEWKDESVVTLTVRKYPGDHTPSAFEVQVDCEAGTGKVEGKPAVSLQNLEPVLNEVYNSGKRI